MSVCIECFCVCRSRSNASWGSENSWLADTQEVDVAAPPKPPYKTDQTCTKQLTCYLLFVFHIYSYFQLAVCFERQYIFKQFIFLCIAYMVYFNLSCMAHTLGKFTLVRSSYCVFTLFFACVRYQKKKKWDGIYLPPFFFYTEDEENNTIKQWLGFRYTKPQSDVQLTRITNTLYGCHQLLSFSQKQRWSVHGFRGHLVSTTMTNLFLCEKTKESLISLINNIHILWNQNMMHRGL